MTVRQALEFCQALTLSPKETAIASQILKEIRARLQFMIDVGLDYLSLDRVSSTLSGGETRARQFLRCRSPLGRNRRNW
jgi:excinuclease ABC subunit A